MTEQPAIKALAEFVSATPEPTTSDPDEAWRGTIDKLPHSCILEGIKSGHKLSVGRETLKMVLIEIAALQSRVVELEAAIYEAASAPGIDWLSEQLKLGKVLPDNYTPTTEK